MRRTLLVFVIAAACGGKQKPAAVPLPPDEAKADPADKPADKSADKSTDKPAEPPKPLPPLEVTVASPKVTVKLVSAGNGKRAPLKLTPKQGDKQQVELALDFSEKQKAPAELGGDTDNGIPTVVLTGDVEVKSVDKDGKAEYQLTVSGTDARAVAAQTTPMPLDKVKAALGSLQGLTIGGTIDANGAASDLKLRVEKPDPATEGALELIRVALPHWPVLPTEPIGVGAKWQVTQPGKLLDRVDVTQTTDYELVSHKGTTWTIKGTTKVTGSDQDFQGAKLSKIAGTGNIDVALVDGAFYPTMKAVLDTGFTASLTAPPPGGTPDTPQKTVTMTIGLKQGAQVTPKP